MPEDKFNFSPESLNLPGSEYKSVRTFAVQVKQIVASNYPGLRDRAGCVLLLWFRELSDGWNRAAVIGGYDVLERRLRLMEEWFHTPGGNTGISRARGD